MTITTAAIPEYRRGSVFDLFVPLVGNTGEPITTAIEDLAAQIYDAPGGNMLQELTIATTATVGTYLLSATLDPEAVALWPNLVYTNIFNITDKVDSTVIAIKILGQLSREIPPEGEL